MDGYEFALSASGHKFVTSVISSVRFHVNVTLYEKIRSLSVYASKVSIRMSCLCVTQMGRIPYL